MALTLPTHFKFKPFNLPNQNLQTHHDVFTVRKPSRTTTWPSASLFLATHYNRPIKINPKLCSNRKILTRVCSDGGGTVDANPQQSTPSVSSELPSFYFKNVHLCFSEYTEACVKGFPF